MGLLDEKSGESELQALFSLRDLEEQEKHQRNKKGQPQDVLEDHLACAHTTEIFSCMDDIAVPIILSQQRNYAS